MNVVIETKQCRVRATHEVASDSIRGSFVPIRALAVATCSDVAEESMRGLHPIMTLPLNVPAGQLTTMVLTAVLHAPHASEEVGWVV